MGCLLILHLPAFVGIHSVGAVWIGRAREDVFHFLVSLFGRFVCIIIIVVVVVVGSTLDTEGIFSQPLAGPAHARRTRAQRHEGNGSWRRLKEFLV